MFESSSRINDLIQEQKQLEESGKLHWFHWIIILGSVVVTLGVWSYANKQSQQKTEDHFNRQSNQAIALISERMLKYEDALWGGVAAMESHNNDMNQAQWSRYANALKIDKKYPGINGIGVIHHVLPAQLEAYLSKERLDRPDYQIHPAHNQNEYFPITYIEPLASNAKAVGLDMAHEANRYTAAKKACATGKAQITGPITLVQDSESTPGFLFYAPFYRENNHASLTQRIDNFIGIIYAPFIFKKLMEGTLAAENRSIGIEILDGDESLYNEHNQQSEDFDPNPIFKQISEINMYGRTWHFDIRSTQSFRAQTSTAQPQIILFGGLFIDSMLFLLFMLLARANRKAVRFANTLTQEYKVKSDSLEQANSELEEFAYRTSHDLRSPLMSSLGVLSIAEKAIEAKDDKKALMSIAHANKSLLTLKTLVEDILNLTKIKSANEEIDDIDFNVELKEIIENLAHMDGFHDIDIRQDLQFNKTLSAKKSRLVTIALNLISNAIKYRDPEKEDSYIQISTYESEGSFVLCVEDNGLGIPEDKQADLFSMFKRFHPQVGYGSGLGLYMIKKSAGVLGGEIVYLNTGDGSRFTLTIPLS